MAARPSGPDDGNGSVVWRWSWLRLSLAALPTGLIFALFQSSLVPGLAKLIVFVIFAASVAAPVAGLLAVAALAPLGQLVAAALGAHGLRLTDAIAAAFIAGWLLRGLPDHRGPAVAAPLAGWLFNALVMASLAGVAWQTHKGLVTAAEAFTGTARSFFLLNDDSTGVIAGARFLAGFALTAATITLFRQRPVLAVRLPAATVVSATVVAVSLVVPSGVIDGIDVTDAVGLARALGAYFALVSCLAIGVTLRAQRRTAWTAASVCLLLGFGLVMSRVHEDLVSAIRRTEPLIQASLRVVESRALFGSGIGQDASTAPLFFSPWLSWNGGTTGSHNLLVIGVELGVVGLALWLTWIGAGLLRAARALTIDRRDTRLWGAAAGVVVFLAALAVSRPLAFSETVFPFLMQFGLMTALAGSTLLNATAGDPQAERRIVRTRQAWQRFAVATFGMSVIAVGALISARRGPIERPESRDVDGFYGWETSASGERFRWMEEYASVFVPAGVTRVRIPVRVPTSPAAAVELKTDSGGLRRVDVNGDWSIVDVALPASARTRRIDLRASRRVQVGEYQFVRDP